MPRILDRNEEQFVRESDKGVKEKWKWSWLTPLLRRPYIHTIFIRPPVGQRVPFFESFAGRRVNTPLVVVAAPAGCDKRWMTCIHAGVSRSPREHASVPPDKRHCRQ